MAAQMNVSVVDDDGSIRMALPHLLTAMGYAVRAFASAEEFLDSGAIDGSDCVILDVAMPGMSGPGLRRELAQRGRSVPTIFITAHKDESARQRLLDDGAVECLFKPFSETALLEALRRVSPKV